MEKENIIENKVETFGLKILQTSNGIDDDVLRTDSLKTVKFYSLLKE
jgi:hypothetical protein